MPVTYIHDLPDWPRFVWDETALSPRLAGVRHRQGRLIGRMEALGFALRSEAVLQTLTQDVVQSSDIEGAVLDAEQVRSSIARRLGMDIAGLRPAGLGRWGLWWRDRKIKPENRRRAGERRRSLSGHVPFALCILQAR